MTKAAKLLLDRIYGRTAAMRTVDWEALRLRDRIRPGRPRAARRHQSRRALGDNRASFCRITPIGSGSCCARRVSFPSPSLSKTTTGCPSGATASPTSSPRPTPGINDLRPAEYVKGWRVLERKIRTLQAAGRGARRRDAVPRHPAVAASPMTIVTAPEQRRAADGRAPASAITARRCSCCPIRAAGTPISATRRCWTAFRALARYLRRQAGSHDKT